jgi:hypothetical protein
VEDAAADGSAANHADVHLLHKNGELAVKLRGGQFNFQRHRAAGRRRLRCGSRVRYRAAKKNPAVAGGVDEK